MTNDDIKAWCKANSITQAQLSKKIGYSSGTLAQVLNGLREMKPRMLEAIKRVMDEHARPQTSPLSQDAYANLREKLETAEKSIQDAKQTLEALAPSPTQSPKE